MRDPRVEQIDLEEEDKKFREWTIALGGDPDEGFPEVDEYIRSLRAAGNHEQADWVEQHKAFVARMNEPMSGTLLSKEETIEDLKQRGEYDDIRRYFPEDYRRMKAAGEI